MKQTLKHMHYLRTCACLEEHADRADRNIVLWQAEAVLCAVAARGSLPKLEPGGSRYPIFAISASKAIP